MTKRNSSLPSKAPAVRKTLPRWVKALLVFTLLDLVLGLAALIYFQAKFL